MYSVVLDDNYWLALEISSHQNLPLVGYIINLGSNVSLFGVAGMALRWVSLKNFHWQGMEGFLSSYLFLHFIELLVMLEWAHLKPWTAT